MKKALVVISTILFIVAVVFFCFTPSGTIISNNWFHAIQKADDNTNYYTLKKVEDTCRSMMASYDSDRLMFEQYANSVNPKEQEWAQQAKIRANKTASSYNNFILKNSYVWKGNVPKDICAELDYLK